MLALGKGGPMNIQSTDGQFGVVEGFFGRSWTWKDRKDYASFCHQHRYTYYIYAPKNDVFLRRRWTEPWPIETKINIQKIAVAYETLGVKFGVGLSPYELYLDLNKDGLNKLTRKIREINDVPCEILCILFDDMRGDIPNIAETQINIVHHVAEISTAEQIIMCPTYYSYDPVLEKVFGKCPDKYLETIGMGLDKNVDVFWTGPEVCSKEYPEEHILEVTQKLQRKPVIWDNYPVNDGAKKSNFLHLMAFENHPAKIKNLIKSHVVNPMNQGWLSRIPLFTLSDAYQTGDDYSPIYSFKKACNALCEKKLSDKIIEDMPTFNYVGLLNLKFEDKQDLIRKYQRHTQSPYANEIIDWLEGQYTFDPACLTE
jgi:hyaluronoglucosaminidase